MVSPLAVRLRRDFKTLLMLIRAHALLHQATRPRDGKGRVVATPEDYGAVRLLIGPLVAEGIDATVKAEVREIVEAASHLLAAGISEVHQTDLVRSLKLDKSSISRRVAAALDAGFLRNLEERKGRQARLVLGDPLPADVEVLPSPERLVGSNRLQGCAVDRVDIEPPGWSADPAWTCAWCKEGEQEDSPLCSAGAEAAGHIWLHSACRRPWYEDRQTEAAGALGKLAIAGPIESPNNLAKTGAA
jgi:hypothetical protein